MAREGADSDTHVRHDMKCKETQIDGEGRADNATQHVRHDMKCKETQIDAREELTMTHNNDAMAREGPDNDAHHEMQGNSGCSLGLRYVLFVFVYDCQLSFLKQLV